MRYYCSEGFNSQFFGFFLRHDNKRSGSVVDSGCVSGCNRSVLLKGWSEFCQFFRSASKLGMLVCIKYDWFFLPLRYFYGKYFILEPSGSNCFLGPKLALKRKSILLLTVESPLFHYVFSSHAHVVSVEYFPKSVHYHWVVQFSIAHSLSPSAVLYKVGSHAHVFRSTRNNYIAIARNYLLHCKRNSFKARTANHVDRPGRNFAGDSRFDSRLPSYALSVSGLKHAAENNFVHFFGRDF